MPRRLAVALVALLLAAGALPAAGSAQWSPGGLADAGYASPAYGFGVRWRSAEWQVDQQRSDAAGDLLQLADDAGNAVRYIGTDRYGDDPAACRADLLDTLGKVPNVSGVEPVRDSAGHLIWLENAAEAFGLYQFRLEDRFWVAWLDCQTLVPGRAVLAVAQFGPADGGLAADHAQANRVVPTRQSALPYGDKDRPPDWTWFRSCWSPPGALLDFGSGSPFPDAPATGPNPKWFRFHLYQRSGMDGPAAYDAGAVVLIDTNDVVHHPVRFAWSGALADPDNPVQSFAPGEGADLTLLFDLPDGVLTSRVLTARSDASQKSRFENLECGDDRRGHPVRPLQVEHLAGTSQVSFVVGPAGDELGMVTWLDATGDETGDVALLRFANTGQSAWTFDPTAIVAEGGLGPGDGLLPPNSVRGDADPVAPAAPSPVTGPITLDPGEETTLALAFPPQALACAHLWLIADPQIIPLGDGPACGGAGGAAPVIRTGE